jgi:hypothetical protein
MMHRHHDIVLEMAAGTVRRIHAGVDRSWIRPTWVAE